MLAGAATALPVLYLLVISVPYRRARLFAFLEPERDPLGAGFQAMQSLIAVGSGGLLGLGPGNSLQKLYFLPHPESDFVYAIVAERERWEDVPARAAPGEQSAADRGVGRGAFVSHVERH